MISCKLNAHQPYSIGNPFGCQNEGRVAYVGCEPTVLGELPEGSAIEDDVKLLPKTASTRAEAVYVLYNLLK